MSYTFLSAGYANADQTAIVVQTVEAGAVALSLVDTPSAWEHLLESGIDIAPFVSPPVVTTLRKADIYARATEAEAEAIDAAVNGAGAKLRGLWNASLEFCSDSAHWPQSVAMAQQLFGPARAAELLSPAEAF